LFNVAITRARKKQICFISRDVNSLPAGLLKEYLEYVQNYISSAKQDEFSKNRYKNSFEQTVAEAFVTEGLEVKSGFKAAGVNIDLLVKDEFGNQVIVEIDGVEDNVKANIHDMKKQTILERAGYRVERISYREWSHSSAACVDRIKRVLETYQH
jgi:very-short-patch-repair endonuclease